MNGNRAVEAVAYDDLPIGKWNPSRTTRRHHRSIARHLVITLTVAACAATALTSTTAAAQSPLFKRGLNTGHGPLKGYVDLHTHPMSHLGFGGKLVHGAPDVGALVPPGHRVNDCGTRYTPAASAADALGTCLSNHGGWDAFKNKCGNLIRNMVVNEFTKGRGVSSPHYVPDPQGWPTFVDWPKSNDILHQQMWIDWIRRAYDGGMRVMVGLAVNSRTFAVGIESSPPQGDKESGDLQVAEMKAMAARHADWMEVAYSPADLRRIVGQDKLALILGLELDDIGDFGWSRKMPSADEVRAEIRRLHGLGVRYMFPIHLTDNYFGGTAIYETEFARANRYQFGQWWQVVCAGPTDEIGHQVTAGWDVFKTIKLGEAGGTQPLPTCPTGIGHMNGSKLADLGRVALDEMMSLGILIDIDHMGQYTTRDTLQYTRRDSTGLPYSVISGHNGLRPPGGSERQLTASQYRMMLDGRPTIAGVGTANTTADVWLQSARAVAALGVPIAIGSDINGLEAQPGPRKGSKVLYSDSFPMSKLGRRGWDYNQDGVAHIGLYPDFLRDVENLGGQDIVNQLFDGAEALARVWERAVARPLPQVTVETSTNRAGGDYRNFEVPSNRIGDCTQACRTDDACRAYTFVRPGIQGPTARCWLKQSAPAAAPDGCCISGVKR